jgi:hypothetical protein
MEAGQVRLTLVLRISTINTRTGN